MRRPMARCRNSLAPLVLLEFEHAQPIAFQFRKGGLHRLELCVRLRLSFCGNGAQVSALLFDALLGRGDQFLNLGEDEVLMWIRSSLHLSIAYFHYCLRIEQDGARGGLSQFPRSLAPSIPRSWGNGLAVEQGKETARRAIVKSARACLRSSVPLRTTIKAFLRLSDIVAAAFM